jgi:S-formylglutathione hydrolase FrmB
MADHSGSAEGAALDAVLDGGLGAFGGRRRCGRDALMLDWPLTSGAIPVVLACCGAGALLFLLVSPAERRWWTRTLPAVLVAVAGVVAAAAVTVAAAAPFPDPLPAVVWWSVAAGAGGVGLAAAGVRRGGRGRRWVSIPAAVLVLAAAGNQVNQHFEQYPTPRALFGFPPLGQVDFAAVTATGTVLVTRAAGRSLAEGWHPPAALPTAGVVAQVMIPAPVSGFPARPGWLYLPPAYLTSPRAQLPVLMALSGQPGTPRDWLDGGRLARVMDAFAAAHAGLAPVVVMPDPLGSTLANPLCLDSRLGAAQTYLSVDVPAWIRADLQVDPAPQSWAVAGFSAGGTCALQLALNTARVYPTFIDISGQSEPTLGDRRATIAAAFGGDTAAFTAVNPLDLLTRHRYPDTAGVIVAGRDDGLYRPQALQVMRVARAAGLQIGYRELPGGHDWRLGGAGLETSLPWLAGRLRLIP